MTRILLPAVRAVIASVILSGVIPIGWADVIASSSLATVHLDAEPSPEAGFITYTFSVEAASMMEVGTIDAAFTASSMNQINPLGFSSIFTEANAAIEFFGQDPQSDSQFEFDRGPDLLVLSEDESSTLLQSKFSWAPGITTARPFAHVVLPINVSGVANLTFVVRPIGQVEGPAAVFNNIAFGAAIPEVSSFLMGGVVLVGILLHRSYVSGRRRSRVSSSVASPSA